MHKKTVFILLTYCLFFTILANTNKQGNSYTKENKREHLEAKKNHKEDDGHDKDHKDEKENDGHDKDHKDEKEDDGHDKDHKEEKDDDGHDKDHKDEKEDDGHDKDHKEEKDDKHGDSESEDEDNTIELSPAAIKVAEIQTEVVMLKRIPRLIIVPGELFPDPNLFTKVSVRISCQVEKLWVNIGEQVKKGQPLVTLSSIEMSELQGQLLDSYNNWRRLKSLVKTKAISEIQYKKSEIEFFKTISILVSNGMTKQQVTDLIKEDNPSKITGNFIVLSPQSGKIYTDNLELGKRFIKDKEDDNELLSVIDDSSLWVKASLPGNDINQVKKGAKAIISNERNNIEGKVIQVIPKLDHVTRTQKVIISISNKDDKLHPGEFVDCKIEIKRMQSVIVVPEASAFRLPDGDWVIYEEVKPNHFKQREISIIDSFGKNIIIEGVEPGSKIVTNGAFAVHSELQKSGFSVHNH
jgi:membrane fusion protein, heavy metal efflux system